MIPRKDTRRPFLTISSLCVLLLLCGQYVGRRAGASSGARAGAAAQATGPADGGSWDAKYNTVTVPVHISLLPSGRLLYWGRDKAVKWNPTSMRWEDDYDVGEKSNTYLVDPLYLDDTRYTAIPSPTPPTNLFCSGHSFLPDGRLLVTGGHQRYESLAKTEGIGEPDINIFDYRTNTWTPMTTAQSQMARGRWYPYNVTLPNGETLIMAGSYWDGFTFSNGKPQPSFNLVPEVRGLDGNIRSLTFDNSYPDTSLRNYPYISLAPDGRVFLARPTTQGHTGDHVWRSRLLDPYAPNPFGGLGVFTAVASPQHRHWEGTSVLYAQGKVLLIGGSEATLGATNVGTVETITLPSPTPTPSQPSPTPAPTWSQVSSLASPRQFPTATLLPDGKVLVTGGTSCNGVNRLNCGPGGTYGGAVRTPELWDPADPAAGWRQMTPALGPTPTPRVYHSVALLLPDARVLVGGGGLPAAAGETAASGAICAGTGPEDTEECRNVAHKSVEIFSPPYLYNADGTRAKRPAITSAPESMAYGQSATIGVGNVGSADGGSASNIAKVVLIRLPSVTHTYNQDQRRVELTITGRSGDSLTVAAPANGVACPPGPYMMFLISNNGRNTPSVARVVRVGPLSLDRTSETFPQLAEHGSLQGAISVKEAQGVSWAAEENVSWLAITGIVSVNDYKEVRFTVDPNPSSAPRSARIVVRIPGQESGTYEFNVHQAGSFSDVTFPPGGSVGFTSIGKIQARGIATGYENGTYGPTNNVTRAEMAVFLTRLLLGEVPPAPAADPFTDVPKSHWAAGYIEYIKRRGITTGYGDGNYGPGNLVTRAEMAVFLLKALGVDNPTQPAVAPFDDVPVSQWYSSWVAELKRRQITGGCNPGGTEYCPTNPVTREQLAIFLARAFRL